MKHVRFATKKLETAYDSLVDGDDAQRQLHAAISRAVEDLKDDQARGTKIPKRLWPHTYTALMPITNLWKYDLPKGWRLIYTVASEDAVEIVSILLEWLSHPDYGKRFGYKRR